MAAVVVDVVIKIFKNNIDRIRQHCNLPKPVKRAINVTINTAALERQALFVVAMAVVKHPRFRLSNFILFPYPSKVLRRSLPFLTSHFFLSRPFSFFFPSLWDLRSPWIGYIPLHLSKAVWHGARDPDLLLDTERLTELAVIIQLNSGFDGTFTIVLSTTLFLSSQLFFYPLYNVQRYTSNQELCSISKQPTVEPRHGTLFPDSRSSMIISLCDSLGLEPEETVAAGCCGK